MRVGTITFIQIINVGIAIANRETISVKSSQLFFLEKSKLRLTLRRKPETRIRREARIDYDVYHKEQNDVYRDSRVT